MKKQQKYTKNDCAQKCTAIFHHSAKIFFVRMYDLIFVGLLRFCFAFFQGRGFCCFFQGKRLFLFFRIFCDFVFRPGHKRCCFSDLKAFLVKKSTSAADGDTDIVVKLRDLCQVLREGLSFCIFSSANGPSDSAETYTVVPSGQKFPD